MLSRYGGKERGRGVGRGYRKGGRKKTGESTVGSLLGKHLDGVGGRVETREAARCSPVSRRLCAGDYIFSTLLAYCTVFLSVQPKTFTNLC
jgi:hypothetical protein